MHENTLDTLRVKNTKIKKELIDLKESDQCQGNTADEVNKIFSQKRKTRNEKVFSLEGFKKKLMKHEMKMKAL